MSDCKGRVSRLREAAVRVRWTPRLTSVRKILCQDIRQLFARARLRKVIPLGKVALHVAQLRQLLGGLHPLGDHLKAQSVRQLDHRFRDLCVLRNTIGFSSESSNE